MGNPLGGNPIPLGILIWLLSLCPCCIDCGIPWGGKGNEGGCGNLDYFFYYFGDFLVSNPDFKDASNYLDTFCVRGLFSSS